MERPLAARRSDRVLAVLGLLAAGVVATWFDGARLRAARHDGDVRNQRLASDLGLTDVCLFGEAPWLRHLSQGDVFSSLQDGPGAFDHARSGSIVAPPGLAVESHESVAEPPALPR